MREWEAPSSSNKGKYYELVCMLGSEEIVMCSKYHLRGNPFLGEVEILLRLYCRRPHPQIPQSSKFIELFTVVIERVQDFSRQAMVTITFPVLQFLQGYEYGGRGGSATLTNFCPSECCCLSNP